MERWMPELYPPDVALPEDCSFGWKIGHDCILPYIYPSPNGLPYSNWFQGQLGMPFKMGMATGILDGILGTIEFIYKASKGIMSTIWTAVTKPIIYGAELIAHGIKHRSVTKMLEKFGEDTAEVIAGYVTNVQTVYNTIMDLYNNTSTEDLKQMLQTMGNSIVNWMGNTILTTEEKTYGYYVGIVAFEFILAAFSSGTNVASKYLGKILSSITNLARTGGDLVADVLNGADKFATATSARFIGLRCKILGTGCFVAGTPVLMANKRFNSESINEGLGDIQVSEPRSGWTAKTNQYRSKQTGKAIALAAAMPMVAVPIQDIQLLDYAMAHETVNSTSLIDSDLVASADENIYYGLLNSQAERSRSQDPYTSDQQRARDEYEINDRDWNEVVFEQVNGSSTARLALHNDWINKKGYQVNGVVNLDLPEQGISGPFRITSIKHIIPQKKPSDEDESDNYDYRPVTAIFTHVSDQVYTIDFDNGESLGVTFQHPVYSVTAGDWRLAGALEVGEEVLTKSGTAKVVCSEREEGSEVVYNLEVKELHNFLVGESGVVVHNACNKALVKEMLEATEQIEKLPSGPRKEMLNRLNELLNSTAPQARRANRFLDEFAKDVPLKLGLTALTMYFDLTDEESSCANTLFSQIGSDRTAFKRRLLEELTPPEFEQFCEDFVNSTSSVYNRFEENVGMVRAWKSLIDSPLRTNTYWLGRVSRWENSSLDFDYVYDLSHNTTLVYKEGLHVAELYEDLFIHKYEGFGLDVQCPLDRTTTIIGLLGTEDPTRLTGTRYFFDVGIYKRNVAPNNNPGGINILNLDVGWTLTVNMQWLQNAMDRGDIIRIISDPNHPRTIWENGIDVGQPGHNGIKTITGKEIDYLIDRDYFYDPSIPGYRN